LVRLKTMETLSSIVEFQIFKHPKVTLVPERKNKWSLEVILYVTDNLTQKTSGSIPKNRIRSRRTVLLTSICSLKRLNKWFFLSITSQEPTRRYWCLKPTPQRIQTTTIVRSFCPNIPFRKRHYHRLPRSVLKLWKSPSPPKPPLFSLSHFCSICVIQHRRFHNPSRPKKRVSPNSKIDSSANVKYYPLVSRIISYPRRQNQPAWWSWLL
jgi:hypothetical protein